MGKLNNLGKALMVAGAMVATEQAKGQMALDQTTNGTNEQIYKTIVFANGNVNNNPSYNYTGPKNIDPSISSTYGGQVEFWRNTGGAGTFVETNAIGAVTATTVPNEMVGGNVISWNQAQSLKKNLQTVPNSLGINYTGEQKRSMADTNNDGQLDAQFDSTTLPSGTEAQSRGFQIGDIAMFATPDISTFDGTTLLVAQWSCKKLNNNWEWEDSTDVPSEWNITGIVDWISEGLSTDDVNKIRTTIYPNPTTDKIFIKLDNGQRIEQYQLVNMAGQQLLAGKDMSNGVDVSRLPAGMYILQLNIDDKITTHKVIKK